MKLGDWKSETGLPEAVSAEILLCLRPDLLAHWIWLGNVPLLLSYHPGIALQPGACSVSNPFRVLL